MCHFSPLMYFVHDLAEVLITFADSVGGYVAVCPILTSVFYEDLGETTKVQSRKTMKIKWLERQWKLLGKF